MSGIEWLDSVFMQIGFCTIAIVAFVLLLLLATGILDLIERAILHYKIKHRFSKKPLAKCYCVDCKYYSKEDHYCSYQEIFVVDNFYCKDAKPRKEK